MGLEWVWSGFGVGFGSGFGVVLEWLIGCFLVVEWLFLDGLVVVKRHVKY